MKPYKFVLPLMALAALGLSFSALAGQAETNKDAKTTAVKVGPVSVMNMVQNSTPAAPAAPPVDAKTPSVPTISISGVDSEDLQKVLNEALSFKGSDAEFAKKAAEWKSKFGVTVTRKGPGHVTLSKGEGSSSTRVEIYRSEKSREGRSSLAPRVKAAAPSERVRVLSPDSKAFFLSPDKDIRIDLRDLADVKTMSPKEKAEFDKAMSEMRKSLKELEGFSITLPDSATFAPSRKMSAKERAKLEKELAEVRRDIVIKPGALGDKVFEFRADSFPHSQVRVLKFGANVKGLSEADSTKMNDEIAKVHADAEKKIDSIVKKYQEKAKKAAK